MSSLRFDRCHNIFDLQPLEVRRFFTTAVVGLNNTLEILGTASAETITVNRNTAGRITVSGVATQFTVGGGAGQINKILIQAAAGNDTVLLTNNVRVPATGVGIPATIAGNAGHDSITGGPGNDIINGNDGNDMMDGGGGNDEFTGGANFDTANYSTRTGAIVVTIGVGANDGEVAAAEADNVTATVEEVIGGAGNDTITGSGNADYIAGGGGNDSMTGGDGGDQLTGSAGQDKFFGQSGDDFLLAQNSDQDTVNGGTNADLTPDLDLASVDPIDIPARGALNFLIAAAEGSPSALDPTYSPDDGIAELTPVDYNPLTGVDGQGRVAFLYDQYGQNGGNGYGYDVVARRLDADGNIDDGFGAVVIDTTEAADVGQGYNVDDTRMGVAFGADGSMFVLIARSRFEGNRGFAVAKLTPAGVLDTTYGGGDGIAVFEGASLTGANDFMTAIAVQDDGKVVVAGSVYEISQGGDQDFLVARLTTTGLLDNTANGGAGNFNGAGFRQVDLANAVSDMEWTNDIAFQKIDGDGAAQRIVIAGATESDGRQGALIRFTAAGALDTSFGTGGSRSYLVGDVTEIKRIAINAANEIFLLGNETTIPIIGKGITVSSPTSGAGTFDFVAKLNANANDAGQVNLDSANLNDVTTDAQGRAIAVGESGNDFYVIRYNSDFTPDDAFADGGYIAVDANGGEAYDVATSVRVLGSGKIVVGGYGIEFNESPVGLAIRLEGEGAGVPPNSEGNVEEVEDFLTYDDIHDPNSHLFDNVSAPAKFYSLSQPDDDGIVRIDLPPELDKTNVVSIYNVMAGDGQINVAVDVDGLVLYYDPDDTTRIEIYTKLFGDSITADNNVAIPLLIDAGDGNDVVIGGGQDDVILGGKGNDFINGNDGDDAAVGGDGNDSILGWRGNDILIGGKGSDIMFGYFGDNILVAGYTDHDNNVDALDALIAEWTSGDPARVSHIRNGGGLNGSYKLRTGLGATVFDDGASDYLTLGGSGDWFFYKQTGSNRDYLVAGTPSIKDFL